MNGTEKHKSLELLTSKINNTPETKKTPTNKQMFFDLHDANMQDKKQIKLLRWLLFGVIVIITLSHLGVLYWFLDKAGNANLKSHGYFLSDSVLIAFLSTTTFDIIGLLFIIVKFVFNMSKQK